MNLIPDEVKNTGNYFCTWDSQCDEMYTMKQRPKNRTARDAMSEEFLFGENGLLNSFEGVRKDLTVVLDDGWDVPFGALDSRVFGSLEADTERFPSLSGLSPVERLKKLSERIVSLGYKGLGLWVPSQSQMMINGKEISRSPDEERLYWEERAKWCGEADILYLKVDWGAHSDDAEYRKMMTECMRKFAPKTAVEHAFTGYPLFETDGNGISREKEEYLETVLTASDYLRTYDVVHELKYASTVDRVSICLKAAKACNSEAVLNIEDTALIGAALGCSIGVMRHDFEKIRKYVTLPPRPVSETVCALRWQRIAPPFAAGKADLAVSSERLKDVWHCPKRPKGLWPDVPEGDYCFSAPAAIARNMTLPEVCAEGEKPYVLCSVHPDNGALCVAVTPRTFGENIDFTPLAEICVKGGSADAPVGIFGRFESLRIEFENKAEGKRVFAQSLLSDTARDVTPLAALSGSSLTIPGEVMQSVGAPEDSEKGIPAIAIKLM